MGSIIKMHPDLPTAIEMAEELLEECRAGRIRGIAWVTHHADGNCGVRYGGDVPLNPWPIVYRLNELAEKIKHENMVQEED